VAVLVNFFPTFFLQELLFFKCLVVYLYDLSSGWLSSGVQSNTDIIWHGLCMELDSASVRLKCSAPQVATQSPRVAIYYVHIGDAMVHVGDALDA
jgi:hypothetical protein